MFREVKVSTGNRLERAGLSEVRATRPDGPDAHRRMPQKRMRSRRSSLTFIQGDLWRFPQNLARATI
jgi:hypothetical protein